MAQALVLTDSLAYFTMKVQRHRGASSWAPTAGPHLPDVTGVWVTCELLRTGRMREVGQVNSGG